MERLKVRLAAPIREPVHAIACIMSIGRAGLWQAAPRPVVVVALVTAICLLGDSALYVLMPSRLEVFAVSPAAAGLILAINRYVRVASNSLAARVYERLGFLAPFAGAIVLAAFSTAGYGLFTGFWLLFIAHGLWGVSFSFLRLGGFLAVIESDEGSEVGRLMGVLQSVTRLGSLTAVIAGGLLADAIGSRQTFVIFGVATFSALGLVPLARVPESLGRRPGPQSAGAPAPRSGSKPVAADRGKISMLYVEASLVWLMTGLIVGTAGYLVRTVAGEGATLLGVFIGVGTLSGVLMGVRWAGGLGLGPLFGHLSDVHGRPRVILTAMAVAFVALVLVASDQSLPVVFLAFSVLFIAGVALFVSLNASIGELAPTDRRAAVLSRYSTWADIGSGTGALIGLPLVTAAGFGWVYGAAAAVILVAALSYWSVFVRSAARAR